MTTSLMNDIAHKPCQLLRDNGIRFASSKKAIDFCTTKCPYNHCLIVDEDEDEDEDSY